jgi:iron complex outermembrane receptor protein
MKTKLTALAVAISAQLIPMGNIAIAQEESADKEQEFELIMVTGSFVRRSENF